MAGPIGSVHLSTNSSMSGVAYRPILAMLTTLFFMFGFVTCLNDILVPHLKAVFELNYAESMLVQSIWFLGYAVASIPSSRILEAIGYKRGMAGGLLTMALGAAFIVPASILAIYPLFLGALFVTSCGMSLLQVAANPYVAVIGPADTASTRLNLVQAFNSVGTTIAPAFGSLLILGRSASGSHDGIGPITITAAERAADAQSVIAPYVGIIVVLLTLAIMLVRSRLPNLDQTESDGDSANGSIWEHRNLVLGVAAIFTYLVAEIGVGSLMVSFISSPEIGNITPKQAGFYLSFLWAGMMIGRFAGASLMKKYKPENMLAIAAVGAFFLICSAILNEGRVAMWSLVLVGLFHSIMFPTIFTLAIRGLGPMTKRGSGCLVTAVAGGMVANLQGLMADHYGLQHSFLLPAACELFILIYALRGCRGNPAAETASALHSHNAKRPSSVTSAFPLD
jgi:MFS transporter, FHS family, L-fucose permease